jgi:hypothetical protein
VNAPPPNKPLPSLPSRPADPSRPSTSSSAATRQHSNNSSDDWGERRDRGYSDGLAAGMPVLEASSDALQILLQEKLVSQLVDQLSAREPDLHFKLIQQLISQLILRESETQKPCNTSGEPAGKQELTCNSETADLLAQRKRADEHAHHRGAMDVSGSAMRSHQTTPLQTNAPKSKSGIHAGQNHHEWALLPQGGSEYFSGGMQIHQGANNMHENESRSLAHGQASTHSSASENTQRHYVHTPAHSHAQPHSARRGSSSKNAREAEALVTHTITDTPATQLSQLAHRVSATDSATKSAHANPSADRPATSQGAARSRFAHHDVPATARAPNVPESPYLSRHASKEWIQKSREVSVLSHMEAWPETAVKKATPVMSREELASA